MKTDEYGTTRFDFLRVMFLKEIVKQNRDDVLEQVTKNLHNPLRDLARLLNTKGSELGLMVEQNPAPRLSVNGRYRVIQEARIASQQFFSPKSEGAWYYLEELLEDYRE